MIAESADAELPDWFFRPFPQPETTQASLFSSPLCDALPGLGVSIDELHRWRSRKWLSFDPSQPLTICDLDDPIAHEIIFLRQIARSGLSDSQITRLLSGCPKPYNFDPRSVAFSFAYGWISPAAESDPEDKLRDQITDWMDEGDGESIKELRDRLASLVNHLNEIIENSEPEDDSEEAPPDKRA